MMQVNGILRKEVFLFVLMFYHYTAATEIVFVWDPQNFTAGHGKNGNAVVENKDAINETKVSQEAYTTLPHTTPSSPSPKEANRNLHDVEDQTESKNTPVRISTEVGMNLHEVSPGIPIDGVSGPDIPPYVENVLKKLFGLSDATGDLRINDSILPNGQLFSNSTTQMPPLVVTMETKKGGQKEPTSGKQNHVENLGIQYPSPEDVNQQKKSALPTYTTITTAVTKPEPKLNDLKATDQTYLEQKRQTMKVNPIPSLTTTENPPNTNQDSRKAYNITVSPPNINQDSQREYNIPVSPPNMNQDSQIEYNIPVSPPNVNQDSQREYRFPVSPPNINQDSQREYNIPVSPPNVNQDSQREYRFPVSPPNTNQDSQREYNIPVSPPNVNQDSQREYSIPVSPPNTNQDSRKAYTIPVSSTSVQRSVPIPHEIPSPPPTYAPAYDQYYYGSYSSLPTYSYVYPDQVYGYTQRSNPSMFQYPVTYYVRQPRFYLEDYGYRSQWDPRSIFLIQSMKDMMDSFN